MHLSIDVLNNEEERNLVNHFGYSYSNSKRKHGTKIRDDPEKGIRYANQDKIYSCYRTDSYNGYGSTYISRESKLYNAWICRGLNLGCTCIHCKLCLIKYFSGDTENFAKEDMVLVLKDQIISEVDINVNIKISLFSNTAYNQFDEDVISSSNLSKFNRLDVVNHLGYYNGCVYDTYRVRHKTAKPWIKKALMERRDYALDLINSCDIEYNPDLTPIRQEIRCGFTSNRASHLSSWNFSECPNNFKCFDANLEEECSICLSKTSDVARPIKLSCGHQFHESCLGRWLESSPTCPLCRSSNEEISKELLFRRNVRDNLKETLTKVLNQLDILDGEYTSNEFEYTVGSFSNIGG
jgi:hypothetical protein